MKLFKKFLTGLAVLAFAGSVHAGDFSTSSVTYTSPDFSAAGGTRSGSATDSVFFRFPLVAGQLTTFSYTSSGPFSTSIAAFNTVFPEGPGDSVPHPSSCSSSPCIERTGFGSSGSMSFTPTTNGVGTIELSDVFSSTFSYTITMGPLAVPAPATLALLLLGLVGVRMMRRRAAPEAMPA